MAPMMRLGGGGGSGSEFEHVICGSFTTAPDITRNEDRTGRKNDERMKAAG